MMIIITKRWCNKGGHSPVAGYNDTSLTYHPTTVGLDKEYWQSLSYLHSTVWAGWDQIKAKE